MSNRTGKLILILGDSWVGKTSLAKGYCHKYDYINISFGDLLREYLWAELGFPQTASVSKIEIVRTLKNFSRNLIVVDNKIHSGYYSTSLKKDIVENRALFTDAFRNFKDYFLLFEEAILNIIERQLNTHSVLVDGRVRAIELTRNRGLEPFSVLIECPPRIRVVRKIKALNLEVTTDNINYYLALLNARVKADKLHKTHTSIYSNINLLLDSSKLTLEEEISLIYNNLLKLGYDI